MRLLPSLLALLSFCHSSNAADRMALVIGNGNYQHAMKLANPTNDADGVASRLKAEGWEVQMAKEANKRGMRTALRTFCEDHAGARAAMVFYAGHGVEDPATKKNYLLPVDAKLETQDDLPSEALCLDDVLDMMNRARMGLKTVVLDCCRDNPIPTRSWLKSRGGNGLAEVAQDDLPEGTLLVFSTAPGKTAPDSTGKNSPFTKAFLSAMETGGSMVEIFSHVSEQVTAGEPWIRFDNSGKSLAAFARFGLRPSTGQGHPAHVAEVPVTPAPTPLPARPGGPATTSSTASGGAMDASTPGKAMLIQLPGGKQMTFCYCPAGSFTMGSPASEIDRDENENQVQVRISKGYWMAQTECTQGQWESIMGSNPSNFKGSEDLPVEQVSWKDAQAFITKLSRRVSAPDGMKFALPSEAQWEYACRAGTMSVFAFGDTLTSTQANIDGQNYPYGKAEKGTYLGKTMAVRSYEPNAYGLYDMHGNVLEWCLDAGDDSKLPGGTDPVGSSGTDRVYRGGSWIDFGRRCRSAYRSGNAPNNSRSTVGFRVAAVPAGR